MSGFVAPFTAGATCEHVVRRRSRLSHGSAALIGSTDRRPGRRFLEGLEKEAPSRSAWLEERLQSFDATFRERVKRR